MVAVGVMVGVRVVVAVRVIVAVLVGSAVAVGVSVGGITVALGISVAVGDGSVGEQATSRINSKIIDRNRMTKFYRNFRGLSDAIPWGSSTAQRR